VVVVVVIVFDVARAEGPTDDAHIGEASLHMAILYTGIHPSSVTLDQDSNIRHIVLEPGGFLHGFDFMSSMVGRRFFFSIGGGLNFASGIPVSEVQVGPEYDGNAY